MLKHPWLTMDADYDTKVIAGTDKPPVQVAEVEDCYYHQQEMAKLTDGSENDCADGEFDME